MKGEERTLSAAVVAACLARISTTLSRCGTPRLAVCVHRCCSVGSVGTLAVQTDRALVVGAVSTTAAGRRLLTPAGSRRTAPFRADWTANFRRWCIKTGQMHEV